MTSTPTVLLQTKYLEDAETTQYTAPANVRAVRVDDFTVMNRAVGTTDLVVRVVPSGGTPGAEHELIVKTLGIGELYEAPPILLGPGDFIRTNPSAASALVARMAGRVFT